MVDELLNSEEYLDAFGYDRVPFQRNRVLLSLSTTPRYDAYYRGILGFPQIVFTGPTKSLPARSKIKRGGSPADYMDWVKEVSIGRAQGGNPSTDMDYMARFPYRSV